MTTMRPEPAFRRGTSPDPLWAHEDAAGALIRDLFALLQLRRLRGPSDPRVQGRVQDLLGMLRSFPRAESAGGVLVLRVGPHLVVNGVRVMAEPAARLPLEALRRDLERMRLGGLEFRIDLDDQALGTFLELFPKLGDLLDRAGRAPEGAGTDARYLDLDGALPPSIRLLPPALDAAASSVQAEDLRHRARRAFFHALSVSRSVMRHLAVRRVPELRKARSAVHGMIESLTEERFSLLGLTSIQDFDPYTFQHSVHVSVLALALGQELGLGRHDLADLGVAALCHDLGKVRVPKDVLQKPGDFDARDWAVMKTHPLAGARELLRLGGRGGLAVRVMLVSAEHHLRFDGSGYPRLGSDWQQGLFARIVSLADCFDAMTASRAYMRRPFTPDSVVRYMLESAGRMFDPDLLRLFVARIGVFPVGSMVRLESGELGLVLDPPTSPREIDRPRVRILQADGDGWAAGEERDLSATRAADPHGRIQAGCHPLDYGLDVDALLASHYLGSPGKEAAA